MRAKVSGPNMTTGDVAACDPEADACKKKGKATTNMARNAMTGTIDFVMSFLPDEWAVEFLKGELRFPKDEFRWLALTQTCVRPGRRDCGVAVICSDKSGAGEASQRNTGPLLTTRRQKAQRTRGS